MVSENAALNDLPRLSPETVDPLEAETQRIHAIAEFLRTDRRVTSSVDVHANYTEFSGFIEIAYIEREAGFPDIFRQKLKTAEDELKELGNFEIKNDLVHSLVEIHLEHGNVDAAYAATAYADFAKMVSESVAIFKWQLGHGDRSWNARADTLFKEVQEVKQSAKEGGQLANRLTMVLEEMVKLHLLAGDIRRAEIVRRDITDEEAGMLADVAIAEAYHNMGDSQTFEIKRTTVERFIESQDPQNGTNLRNQFIDMLIRTDCLDLAYSQASKNEYTRRMSGISKLVDIAYRYAAYDQSETAKRIINESMRGVVAIPAYDIDAGDLDKAMHVYMSIENPAVKDNIFLGQNPDGTPAVLCIMQIMAAQEYIARGDLKAARECADAAVKGSLSDRSALSGVGKESVIQLYDVYRFLGLNGEADEALRWLDDEERNELLHDRFLSSEIARQPTELSDYLKEINSKIRQKSATLRMDTLYRQKAEILLLLDNPFQALKAASRIENSLERVNVFRSILKYRGASVRGSGTDLALDILKPAVLKPDGQVNRELVADIGVMVRSAGEIQSLLVTMPVQVRDEAKFLIYREAMSYKSALLDTEKSIILDQAIVRLRQAVETGQPKHLSDVTDILAHAHSKEVSDELLTQTRTLYERFNGADTRMLSLLAKTLAGINTFRGNDLVFQIASDARMQVGISRFLYASLVQNGYLPQDILGWLEKQSSDDTDSPFHSRIADAAAHIEAIKVVSRAGILPSSDVLEFLIEGDWDEGDGLNPDILQKRIKLVQSYLKDTDTTTDAASLVDLLRSDRKIAMAYYIHHNREIHFDLVNNYTFEKFWDILGVIGSLEIHEGPLEVFSQALVRAGFSKTESKEMIGNLRAGHHPWHSSRDPEIRELILLDVSNQEVYRQKQEELQNAFGDQGLGLCLYAPYARKKLEERIQQQGRNHELAQELLDKLNATSNLWDRRYILGVIEGEFQFYGAICNELRGPWNELRSKLSIAQVEINDMLNNHYPPVSAESLIYAVEGRRQQLKGAKKELIAALQLDNPQQRAITQEVRRKRKAVQELRKGLSRNPDLQQRIDGVESEISVLETQLSELGALPVSGRYAATSEEERNAMLDEAKKEFEALSTKDTAPVLVYLIAELVDHLPILENDRTIMQEVSSHLSDPLMVISQLRDMDTVRTTSEQLKRVGLSYVDKHADLMRMVRFADSKICCFSSSNYSMRVAHNTENKIWVASINRDPLSFVFELQDPKTKNNTGFVFGSFGVDEDGFPAVMLNGIYLSSGNTKGSVNNILDSIEKNFARRIRARSISISNIYGGKMSAMPEGYDSGDIVLRRLRALDDGNGSPVTKIYDDLSQSINGWKTYGAQGSETLAHEGEVFHKRLRYS